MNRTETLLQLHQVAFVIVSTLLIGFGLHTTSLPIIGTAAALISFVLTERLGWVRLNRPLANLGAVAIAVWSIFQFFGTELNGDAKLSAIASLLTYVQAVLLFQEKSPRLYWNIWILSLLQVVVAMALSIQIQTGALSFLFFLISLSAMCLMTVYVDSQELKDNARIERRRHFRKLALAGVNAGSDSDITPSPRDEFIQFDSRGPLVVSGGLHASHSGDRQDNVRPNRLSSILTFALAGGLLSAILAVPIFYSLPRTESSWQGADFSRRTFVGFTNEVGFDHGPEIRARDRAVMRARFYDDENKSIQLAVDPYFRGAVAPKFISDMRRTRFVTLAETNARAIKNPLPPAPEELNGSTSQVSLVTQRATFDNSIHSLLFAVAPSYATDRDVLEREQKRAGRGHQQVSGFGFLEDCESLVRYGRLLNRFTFEIVTPLYLSDRQLPAIPCIGSVDMEIHNSKPSRNEYPSIYAAVDETKARLREGGRSEDNVRVLAMGLSQYFEASSDDYRYTLDFRNMKIDNSLNPIEDFVANRKAGHCQYYASALALMLRAADVPSRVVIGYHGAEYNSVSGEYLLLEADAHTWVEAYLPPDACSASMFETGQASRKYGAWLRLDPTPSGDDARAAKREQRNLLDRIGDVFHFAQSYWDDNVAGVDSTNQEDHFFKLHEGGFLAGILNGSTMKDLEAKSGSLFRSPWFKVFLAIGLGLILVRSSRKMFAGQDTPGDDAPTANRRGLLTRALSTISPRAANWLSGAPPESESEVAFYDRFVALAREQGFHPRAEQTALEFASTTVDGFASAEAASAEAANENGHADGARFGQLCRGIVDEFYQVRFGGRPLDTDRRASLDAALDELQQLFSSVGASAANDKPGV